jgi:hypothetical protein
MTTSSFFAIFGSFVAVNGLLVGILMKYIDAKLDSKIKPLDTKIDLIKEQVDMLVQYMISHEGRISILEERTKGK